MIVVLFTMLKHGFSNLVLTNTTMKPIIKDKRKLFMDSDKYRAIAPNGSFVKLFDYVIITYFEDVLGSSDQQIAYKPKFSITMYTFMFIETIQYYRLNGSDVYGTLLECSKAFDLARFDKLSRLLLEKGKCQSLSCAIIHQCVSECYVLRVNNKASNNFDLKSGV